MDSSPGNVKWISLAHKGPVFHEPYQELPTDVKLIYEGKEIPLSKEAEEIAGFYAKLLDTKNINDTFNENFFRDWRKSMTPKERAQITDLKKCNFKSIRMYFKDLDKNRTEEEKTEIKRKKEKREKDYGYCTIDGNIEKIRNCRVEQPGLFCGRGGNPKNGRVKKRIMPEDVIINCSESNIPEPPIGHNWKEVKHDQTVMWLASWKNVIQKKKYINLHRKSTQKSDNDQKKFNQARELGNVIEDIRKQYREDWHSPDQYIKERSVALYIIDELALRPGNKKKADKADTVGCCSLRVEHITLHKPRNNSVKYMVEFDFVGKSSSPYMRKVSVTEAVFENLKSFQKNKKPKDKLFSQLNTKGINEYLGTFMPGLTAKVFRTYRASCTMEEKLNELTKSNDTIEKKIESYKEALSHVTKLCNHKKEDTSKLNYIDPRIIVAWSKKNEVRIEKLFTTNQMDIFKWAIKTESNYRFKTE